LAASNGVSQARILEKPHEIRLRGDNWNGVPSSVPLGVRGLPGYWLAPGEISRPAMRVACGLLAVFVLGSFIVTAGPGVWSLLGFIKRRMLDNFVLVSPAAARGDGP
jgi:hypothetical protein